MEREIVSNLYTKASSFLLFFFFSLSFRERRKWIKVEGYFDFRFGKAILCKFDDINYDLIIIQ